MIKFMVAAGAEACGPDIPHVQLGAWRQEQAISPGLGAPEPPGPQAPMFWGGKSRRLCSSVKMQGSGLRWACIPSKLKSYQEWGLKMVRTCPPHTQGDCGNNAAQLGTGVSTHLGTKHTSHGGDSSLRGKSPGVSFHLTSLPLSPIGLFLWPGAHIQETSLPLCLRLALLQHEEARCLLALLSVVCWLFLQIIQVLNLGESKRRRQINLSTKRK